MRMRTREVRGGNTPWRVRGPDGVTSGVCSACCRLGTTISRRSGNCLNFCEFCEILGAYYVQIQAVIHPDRGSRRLGSLGCTGKWPYVLDAESRVPLVIG